MSDDVQDSTAPKPKRRLSRVQVATRLGCSVHTVQLHDHVLKPERERRAPGSRVRVWYDPDVVAKFKEEWRPQRAVKRRPSVERGEAARLVFPMLEQGQELRSIVKQTGLDPTLVRDLRQEFLLTFEAEDQARAEERRLAKERRDARAHARRMEGEARARRREREKKRRELWGGDLGAAEQASAEGGASHRRGEVKWK